MFEIHTTEWRKVYKRLFVSFASGKSGAANRAAEHIFRLFFLTNYWHKFLVYSIYQICTYLCSWISSALAYKSIESHKFAWINTVSVTWRIYPYAHLAGYLTTHCIPWTADAPSEDQTYYYRDMDQTNEWSHIDNVTAMPVWTVSIVKVTFRCRYFLHNYRILLCGEIHDQWLAAISCWVFDGRQFSYLQLPRLHGKVDRKNSITLKMRSR